MSEGNEKCDVGEATDWVDYDSGYLNDFSSGNAHENQELLEGEVK